MASGKFLIKTKYLQAISSHTRTRGRQLALYGMPILLGITIFELLTYHSLLVLVFRLVAIIPLLLFWLLTKTDPKLKPKTTIRLHLVSLSSLMLMLCGVITARYHNPDFSPLYKMAFASGCLLTNAFTVYLFAGGTRKYLHYIFAPPTIFLIIYTGWIQKTDWEAFSLMTNVAIVIMALIIFNSLEYQHKLAEFKADMMAEIRKARLETKIIQQKQRAAELHTKATHDELTNLYNRRVAYSTLEDYIKQANERRPSLTVCFIDVDQLKKVNDCHGHSEGDNLLKTVARSLKEQVRSSDLICRLGGDEFVVIFPSCTAASAEIIIDRIRNSLNKLHHIDFSYGFAEYHHDAPASAASLIETADQNMYRDKLAKQKKHNSQATGSK
jgi:diguanylate cyclase (GGDEF)-like protein